MIVFLFLGSGDVQPWAAKHRTQPVVPEEVPLAGIVYSFFFLKVYCRTNSLVEPTSTLLSTDADEKK